MAAPKFYEGQEFVSDEPGKPPLVYRGGKFYPKTNEPGGDVIGGGDAPMTPLTPGSDSRTRLALGLGPSIDAQRQMYASERWKPGTDNPLGRNPLTSHPIASALEAVPWDGGAVARMAGGKDYQDYQQAGKTFESAFLPILSGAAVTPTEAQRMIRANLPQFGDAPEILAKKSKNRAMMINAASDLMGRPRPFPKIGTLDLGGKKTQSAQPSAGRAASPSVIRYDAEGNRIP